MEGTVTNASRLCPPQELWDWLSRMQPAYMLTICTVGTVGNVFVLLVFGLHSKACTVAEIYLGNLAAADLLLVWCLPFWAVSVANGFHWPFGSVMCRLVSTGLRINMFCSIYSLVLVSVDRFLALVHTLSRGRSRRASGAKRNCAAVWSVSAALNIPALCFRDTRHFPELNLTACVLDYPDPVTGLACDVLLTLLSFLLPLLVILYCSVRIVRALGRGGARQGGAERRATRLVLLVLLVFLLCWTPFHLVTLLDVLFRLRVFSGCAAEAALDLSNQISTCWALSNSALNPLLYVIVGTNFRKKAKELVERLTEKKCGRRSKRSSTFRTFCTRLRATRGL